MAEYTQTSFPDWENTLKSKGLNKDFRQNNSDIFEYIIKMIINTLCVSVYDLTYTLKNLIYYGSVYDRIHWYIKWDFLKYYFQCKE